MSDITPTPADIKAARLHRRKIADCVCETCLRAASEAFARHAAQARLDAIEEAAKVAETDPYSISGPQIANAIRALTSTGGDQK